MQSTARVTRPVDCPAILDAIARREGVSATDLEPPLYEAIDPDALEALLARPADSRVRVSFEYAGYDVLVGSDGTLRIE